MDIAKYQELTGTTVDESDIAKVNAQIRKTRIALESMLGYSLDKKKASINEYDEKGKSRADCDLSGIIAGSDNINSDDLDDPDEVIGSYRLFPYNKHDEYFILDPFVKLHSVKLVFLKGGLGDDANGITHKTFSLDKLRINKTGNVTKSLQRCPECLCSCTCEQCVQLAVDADWLNESCLSDELLYLWTEMIDFGCDDKGDITAETLGTHSYKREASKDPLDYESNITIIKKYAGPNGSVHDMPTI